MIRCFYRHEDAPERGAERSFIMAEEEKKEAVEEKLQDAADKAIEKAKELNNTADHTAEFDAADIESNKVMGILAYLNILVLIPIFAAKDSKFARFHANQGLILFVISAAWGIVSFILGFIPIINILAGIVGWVLGIIIFVLSILGIINAAKGLAKELPIVGKFKLLK